MQRRAFLSAVLVPFVRTDAALDRYSVFAPGKILVRLKPGRVNLQQFMARLPAGTVFVLGAGPYRLLPERLGRV